MEKLAREIVASWGMKNTKYIVVAPPIVDPSWLFSLLRDRNFVNGVTDAKLPFEKLAMAHVDSTAVMEPLQFIRHILHAWGDSQSESVTINRAHLALEKAILRLRDTGITPLLLIPRMHEAIERLSFDVGAILRELNNTLDLKTVVSLPLPYEDYCVWHPSPFVGSDFGQGHHTETLRGYTKEELRSVLIDNDAPAELTELLFELTGGYPTLVQRLIPESARMTENSLRAFTKEKSLDLCNRLIRWIDAPQSNVYKRVAASAVYGINSHDDVTTLTSHPWKSVLTNDNGNLKSTMVGWACVEHLWRVEENQQVKIIRDAFFTGDMQRVLDILETIPKEKKQHQIVEAFGLLAEILIHADPRLAKWGSAKRALDTAVRISRLGKNKILSSIENDLQKWLEMTTRLAEFCEAKEKRPQLRPEEFHCGCVDGRKSELSFFQSLALRIRLASASVPSEGFSAVVTIPESLLQFYCHQKFNIKFWSHEKFGASTAAMLSRSFPGKNWKEPAQGARLGFTDLIEIALNLSDTLPPSDRIFSTPQETKELRTFYADQRGQQLHSTNMTTVDEWKTAHRIAESFLLRVTALILGDIRLLQLPDLQKSAINAVESV